MNTPYINNNILRIMYYPSGLIAIGLCFTIIVAKIKYALSGYNLSNTRDIKKINYIKKPTNDKYSNIELVQMMKLYNMETKETEEIFLHDNENDGPIWF